jgi:hypothetical protein
MPLKNYTSGMPINRIFDSIQKMLVNHGAKQIMFEYSDNGLAIGITFVVNTTKGMLPIKLPVRIEKIKKVFENEGVYYKDEMQPYRTGWKNIHDWIAAQMAMLDTEMVKLEEVFLPYMATPDGHTYFEIMENRGFMLPSGNNHTQEGELIS